MDSSSPLQSSPVAHRSEALRPAPFVGQIQLLGGRLIVPTLPLIIIPNASETVSGFLLFAFFAARPVPDPILWADRQDAEPVVKLYLLAGRTPLRFRSRGRVRAAEDEELQPTKSYPRRRDHTDRAGDCLSAP